MILTILPSHALLDFDSGLADGELGKLQGLAVRSELRRLKGLTRTFAGGIPRWLHIVAVLALLSMALNKVLAAAYSSGCDEPPITTMLRTMTTVGGALDQLRSQGRKPQLGRVQRRRALCSRVRQRELVAVGGRRCGPSRIRWHGGCEIACHRAKFSTKDPGARLGLLSLRSRATRELSFGARHQITVCSSE